MSNKKRLKLSNKSMEYADIDYLEKLSEDEREWMMEFIDGYYNNNHRKYEQFTEHENYDSIKKDIYNMTNARNRCSYSNNYARNCLEEIDALLENEKDTNLVDSMLREDLSSKSKTDILRVTGIRSFKDVFYDLIDSTLEDLSNKDKDHFTCLLRFYIAARRLIKEERKIVLNDKKIAREKEER